METCIKCGKATVYTDLFKKKRKTCLNTECGWTNYREITSYIPDASNQREQKNSDLPKEIIKT
jgi:predicted  nucleic acid-binding Zn-ribbon protein